MTVVGSRKWLTYPVFSPMEPPRNRPRQRFKLLRCVSSQTVLNTVKLALILLASRLQQHERVVQHTCQTCFGRTSSHRLDHQATIRFSPYTFPPRLARFCVCLS
jgi:hypothetical protein